MTNWQTLSTLMTRITAPSRPTVKLLAQQRKINARKVNASGEETEDGRTWQIDLDDPTVQGWLARAGKPKDELAAMREEIATLKQERDLWRGHYEEAQRIIDDFRMSEKVKRAAAAPKQTPLPEGEDLHDAVDDYLVSCQEDLHRPTVLEFASAYTESERTVRRRLTDEEINYREWQDMYRQWKQETRTKAR